MHPTREQRHKQLLVSIGEALRNEKQRNALRAATERFRLGRTRALGDVAESHELLRRARQVKEAAFEGLDENLALFTKNLEARGAKIYFAKDGEQANEIILSIAKDRHAKLIVKSKSLTSEEIFLNEVLEKHGIEAIETDMGERIIQLARERPSHLIAPAIHRDRAQIAELFTRSTHREVPADIAAITAVARDTLREFFLEADVGLTGVNIAVAETGSIIVVTNEGNARLASSLPPVHIALMGFEKLVRSWDEATTLLDVLPKSATGQRFSTYVTIINGPTPYDPSSGPRELHVVILDNARSIARKDPLFREALYCIRCSACMNACPTYKVVGGHVFGHIYAGPIGIPWTALVHEPEEAMAFAPLCISCGLCKNVCPVEIDIPLQISKIKERDIEAHGEFRINKFLAEYEDSVVVASKTAPLSNWILRRTLTRYILEKLFGLDRRRPFPPFSRSTFLDWFRNHKSSGKRKVAYFVDVYANYNDPEIGKATVQVLEANNCEVIVPEQRSSGMPLIVFGYLKKAAEIAEFNVKSFASEVREGAVVVASEPTAAFVLKEVYPKLVDSEEARLVAENSFELFGFLAKLEAEGSLNKDFSRKFTGKVAYHQPCHSRPLNPERPVMRFLSMIGFDPVGVDHGCCGMAGTYGFKRGAEGYDVAMAVGQPLFADFSNPGVHLGVTESSVCKMHIEHGSGRKVAHPAILLGAAYMGAATLG